MYDIVIRFPNKELADQFCSQMSDGFGEGLVDFSFWKQKEGTTGKSQSDFEKVKTDTVAKDTPVYFITEIFPY